MQIEISSIQENSRLDSLAIEDFTRNQIKNMIKEGNLKVNNKIEKPSYKLKKGDIVEYSFNLKEEIPPRPVNIPLDILYEDNQLIVLNKQKGLLVHPTAKNEENTLVNALLYHTKNLSNVGGIKRQGIVHRLDKDTSGLMLAAKTNEAHLSLQKDIQTKKTVRKYLAVCYGVIEEEFGTIDKPLVHYLQDTVKMNVSDVGLEAVTNYKVLERFNSATFLELELKTGRTHQIRCHLSSIGHPLINDDLYGAKGFKNGIFKNLKTTNQVLMSYYLSFTHPVTGEIMKFMIDENNYHPDLIKTLNLLRSEK